jgi:membrane protein YqaA with SNARE-associated domain
MYFEVDPVVNYSEVSPSFIAVAGAGAGAVVTWVIGRCEGHLVKLR